MNVQADSRMPWHRAFASVLGTRNRSALLQQRYGGFS